MASRLNKQLPLYFSFYPDPDSLAADCFTASWKDINAYIFPRFISSVVLKILRKVRQEATQLTVVLPLWPQQLWFSQVLSMITATPVILPASDNLLLMPREMNSRQSSPSTLKHPILKKLKLTAFRISGNSYEVRAFHQTLPPISSKVGGILQKPSIGCTSGNGFSFASRGRLIHFRLMKRLYLTSLQNFSTTDSSGVGMAKSAIHTILGAAQGVKIDTSYFESLVMKGFFNTRPSLPRYATTWDVNILLSFLRDMPSNDVLSLKELNMKISSLFAILLGQRVQTITYLDVEFMNISSAGLEIVFNELLKTSRTSFHLPKAILPRWHDPSLCPVSIFEFYLRRTQLIRGDEKQLLITSVKPHHKASRDSVARWIRDAMKEAGIDTDYYKAHSSRGASVSKAFKSVPLNIVLEAAGWTNAQTFMKHYQKPIEEVGKFARAILEMSE
jgi:hypothetical protein